MEEVVAYLITKIKELEQQNNDLSTRSIDYMNLINENNKLKDMIKYIHDELKAFAYCVSEEAKIGLIIYIEENMEILEDERRTNE